MCFYPNFRYKGNNLSIQGMLHNNYIGNYDSMQEFRWKAKIYSKSGLDCVPMDDIQQIPCGQCVECRLSRSREWAFRCVKEMELYPYNYFLTITYDDDHIPVKQLVNIETGERVISHYFNRLQKKEIYFDGFTALVPDDLSKFIKDLRRYYEYHFYHSNIRFFACGEYGDITKRPHYHSIMFNLPIDDLVYYSSKDGIVYYTSETLNKIWKKGQILITDVTFDTCAYVAGYVQKKITGKGWKEIEERFVQIDRDSSVSSGFSREFIRMSRKPGIGEEYFRTHKKDIYRHDTVYCKKGDRLLKLRPPRYYDRLFEVEFPDELLSIKERRQNLAEEANKLTLANTDMSFLEYQECRKACFDSKFSIKRGL